MLDLSQIVVLATALANGDGIVPIPKPRPAVIYNIQLTKPIPYARLDWSRYTNPQYNIMMNNIESMVPKTSAERHETTVVARHEVPKEEATGLTPAGKLSATVFAALAASALILWHVLRRKSG